MNFRCVLCMRDRYEIPLIVDDDGAVCQGCEGEWRRIQAEPTDEEREATKESAREVPRPATREPVPPTEPAPRTPSRITVWPPPVVIGGGTISSQVGEDTVVTRDGKD